MLTLLLVVLATAATDAEVQAQEQPEEVLVAAPALEAEPSSESAQPVPAPSREEEVAQESAAGKVEVPVADDGTLAMPEPEPVKPVEITLGEKETVVEVEEVRLSMPTEADADAWASEGLRIALGYGYNIVQGTAPAWSYNAHGFLLRPQVRIDERWALGASFQYAFGEGITWAASFEPTFYPLRQLGISLGIGYSGLYLNRPSPFFLGEPDEVASRTLTDGRSLNQCEGSGVNGLARLEYLMVVGPHFATGPFAQANVQWTGCEISLSNNPDPETGKPVIGTQWWRQQGATLGWWLTWR